MGLRTGESRPAPRGPSIILTSYDCNSNADFDSVYLKSEAMHNGRPPGASDAHFSFTSPNSLARGECTAPAASDYWFACVAIL